MIKGEQGIILRIVTFTTLFSLILVFFGTFFKESYNDFYRNYKFEKENNTVIVKVAGVCGKTEQALEEAKTAKKYGYDAVLLSPGGLNDLSESELNELQDFLKSNPKSHFMQSLE